jgi:hypothetical protein
MWAIEVAGCIVYVWTALVFSHVMADSQWEPPTALDGPLKQPITLPRA